MTEMLRDLSGLRWGPMYSCEDNSVTVDAGAFARMEMVADAARTANLSLIRLALKHFDDEGGVFQPKRAETK